MNNIRPVTLLLFLISFNGVAQERVTVSTHSEAVGKNLLTGEPIQATAYTFPERIHNFQIDTLNNYLTIQLRGLSKNGKWLNNKGYVVRYDAAAKKTLWSERIAFEVESIEQYGGITIYTSGGKSYCLDNKTGKQLWEVKNSLIFIDPVHKMGIGYKLQAAKGAENIVEGIDLTNGHPILQRKISRDYGWNEVLYLNDSTLLIVASGLHSLNTRDGIGWDYNTITGKKNYTASAVGAGLGIAAGLLTGTYAVPTGYNLVRDVISNTIIDSLNIYFASKEHLVKLSKEGVVQWQTSLPDDLTSKSWIFKYKDHLVLVNSGYAYMGYRQLDFGKPFIASFDLNTGEKIYLKLITNEKKETIKDIKHQGKELLVIFDDHISKYSIIDGRLVADKNLDTDEYGAPNYFIGDRIFVERDASFISLTGLDSTQYYLYTKSGKIVVLNGNLKALKAIDPKDYYVYYLNKNNLKFIAKGDQTLVIDTDGRKVAEFSASSRSRLLNNRMYSVNGKDLLEIDVKNIFRSKE